MMNQSDWQAVRDSMIADDRAKLGDPPTVEELLAYERGQLSNEDAERVQQLLVAYPELAHAYAASFPDDDASLPGDVIDRQWNAFRAGGPINGPVLPFRRSMAAMAAIAATVAIVFGALLWQQRTETLQPHVLPEHVLMPDGRRGLAEQHYTITADGDPVLLVIPISGPADYETYRLELVRGDSHERIWASEPLRATTSNSFYVEIPSRALRPGTYQIIASGLRGTAQAQVATYTVDVRRAPRR
jgi:hypothetical protein